MKSIYQALKRKFQYTSAGSQYRVEYTKMYDSKGNAYLKPTGKTDLQALYDSKLESTDLSLIVNQMLSSGFNPFSANVPVLDQEIDYTELSKYNSSEVLLAKTNYESNKKKIEEYEAEIKRIEAENKKLEGEGANNE